MRGKNRIDFVVLVTIFISIFPVFILAQQQKVRITQDTAAVRAKPDIESQVIIMKEKGEELEYLDKINEWYKVSVFLEDKGVGTIGYIHSSLVSVEEKKSSIREKKEERISKKDKLEQEKPAVYFEKSRKRTWVGLKFIGGASYILAEDINEGTKGFDSIWRHEFSFPGAGIEGELTPFHIIYDFEGDIIFYIFPNIGLGFGSGYIFGHQNNEMRLTLPSGEGPWVIKPEVRAVPIRAGLYFLIPIGKGSHFTLDAGAGWYLVDYSWYWRGENASGYWMEMDQEASAQNIGYHAGLGFEIELGSHFAFLIEGRARYAEISGFEGTFKYEDRDGDSDTEEGKLYYWREPVFAEKFTFVFISESETPSFTGLSSAEYVRDAVVDLSGFSIQAGLKIKF